ncbi:MAG: CHAP domain-containing protein [Clostridiales bacterium]|nr:CHAP domain-containing protein [Clostridiales bacterium]
MRIHPKRNHPKILYCINAITWFKSRDQWINGGCNPQPGDIIFFNWHDGGRTDDHVGIVEYVKDGYVHTIEGNSDDCVRRRSYPLKSNNIMGYGTPAYPDR